MSSIEEVKPLQISLQHISMATNGFADANLIGIGGFGKVYKGISEKHGCIAIKRLDHSRGQGDREFKMEISLLSKIEHEHIVSLLGYCDEDDEKILVYNYASNGSLDTHLTNKDLTWIQRLHICVDVALGLKYLLDDVKAQHRDVKSSNILLDENWKAKISDFGLSREGPGNMNSFVVSDPVGTRGYVDPDYYVNGYLTSKTDVYSFGVVLWEVLCGRLAYNEQPNDKRLALSILAQKGYTSETLQHIIPPFLYKQIHTTSLLTFSKIAYQCLNNEISRPSITQVVEQLQEALRNQLSCCSLQDQKDEEEAKPNTGDERKRNESKDMPQDIVLRVLMYCDCDGCARKVLKCLEGFPGVEDVITNRETHVVIVRGNNIADPLKVLERVQKKLCREVELLSPVPKPSMEEHNKTEQEEPPKQEEKKHEMQAPLVITETLKVHMHCKGCVGKVKKCILNMEGVESVVPDLNSSQVAVKGNFLATEVVDHVHKRTRKRAQILKKDPDQDEGR